MGNKCSALDCPNANNKNERNLHSFPEDQILRRIWLRECGRPMDWKPVFAPKLCEAHFTPDQYVMDSNGNKYLDKHAVPRIFNFTYTKRNKSLLYKTITNWCKCGKKNTDFEDVIIVMEKDTNAPTLNPEKIAELLEVEDE